MHWQLPIYLSVSSTTPHGIEVQTVTSLRSQIKLESIHLSLWCQSSCSFHQNIQSWPIGKKETLKGLKSIQICPQRENSESTEKNRFIRRPGSDISVYAAAAAKSLQSCPTLCNPIDGSPPGSPVPGILQARTLEQVAISFSNAWKWKVKVKSLSRVWLGNPTDYSPPGSAIHGIFQARELEWGAIAFSISVYRLLQKST